MIRSHFLAAACAVALLACSDNPSAPATGTDGTRPFIPSLFEVTGTVVVTGNPDDGLEVQLKQSDGTMLSLVGSEARLLASVDGGEVLVRGTWDAPPGLVVGSFQVLAMNGRAAIDGVLEITDYGYALRLSSGAYYDLSDPPAELMNHVGDRLWVTGSAEEPPVEFGVIRAL